MSLDHYLSILVCVESGILWAFVSVLVFATGKGISISANYQGIIII